MRGVGIVSMGHGMRLVERLQGTVLGVRRNGIRQFPREVIEAALARVVQRGGAGSRRPEQGRSRLCAVRPVRAAASAHGRLGRVPRRRAYKGRAAPTLMQRAPPDDRSSSKPGGGSDGAPTDPGEPEPAPVPRARRRRMNPLASTGLVRPMKARYWERTTRWSRQFRIVRATPRTTYYNASELDRSGRPIWSLMPTSQPRDRC